MEQKEPVKPVEQLDARLPWNPLWAIVYAVVCFFVSQLLAELLVSIYPWSQHWSAAHATDWLTNSVIAQFVYVVLAESLLVLSVLWWLKHHKITARRIGLLRPKGSDVLYGTAGWLGYLLVFVAASSLLTALFPHFNINQQQEIGFTNVHGSAALVLTFISLVVLPPIAEEIVMRGFIYTSLRKIMKPLGALLITSAIFAAAHLPEGGAAGPLWIGAVDTFILSIFLCILREKTGRLAPGMLTHALKNAIAFFYLFILHVH